MAVAEKINAKALRTSTKKIKSTEPRKQFQLTDEMDLTIKRYRCGKSGFYYKYASGRKVTSKRVLNRISRLVIPPNWQHVQINKVETARIQAVGVDAKERRQYLYHPKWHQQQQAKKFARLHEFGRAIKAFREACISLLSEEEWTQSRACALVCLLLDCTGVRIGNSQYCKENNTFGLTTLRRKHIKKACADSVTLNYVGKHKINRVVTVDDPQLAAWVQESAQAVGYSLFRYVDNNNEWHDVTSDDVNSFIHQYLGDGFSCKDFRTWAASRYALKCLPQVSRMLKENKQRKWQPTLSKCVAKMLGNTPKVCQEYYLHPKLYEVLACHKTREKVEKKVTQVHEQFCSEYEQCIKLESLLMDIISSE